MNYLIKISAVFALVGLTGCASIVNGTGQPMNVLSTPVQEASCELKNSKGQWFVKTPGTATVHRAYGPLHIHCEKGKYQGKKTVQSHTKAMAFGNLVFGGAPGAVIDGVSGAAYDYPNEVTVPMQKR